MRSSETPIHNQKLDRAAFLRSSHTGGEKFATGPKKRLLQRWRQDLPKKTFVQFEPVDIEEGVRVEWLIVRKLRSTAAT